MARGQQDVEKERVWRRRLDKQRKSGLNVREFCRRESVSEPSFYAWRRELKRRDGDSRPESVRKARHAPPAGQRVKHSRTLVPVEVVDHAKIHPRAQQGTATQHVEIVTPGGWRLRLAADVEPARLRALLDVVAGRESATRSDAAAQPEPATC